MRRSLSKVLALLLAVFTLIGVTACGGKVNPPDGSGDVTTDGGAPVTTDAPVTTEGPEYVFDGTTFDGSTFTVLVGGRAAGTFNDFKYNSENATVLDEAVYSKNTAVEEECEIVIEYVEDMGTENGPSTKLNTQFTSGDGTYHIAFVPCYATVPLATSAVLYDLNSIEGLDLTNSWWDQNMNKECTVKDVLFFTTGDITIWDDMQQLIVMFNKDLYKTEGFTENLYDLVDEGKWTYDKLGEYAKTVT